MDATAANEQRAVIWALHVQGVDQSEIARQLGCARSTVRRALKAPGPDGRTRKARFDPAAAGQGLAASMSQARPGGGPDPYGDLGVADYKRAARAGPGLGYEAAYARTLLRQIMEKLDDGETPEPEKHKLRADAARLLSVLARLHRTPGSALTPDGVRWLMKVGREKTRLRGDGRAKGGTAAEVSGG